MMRVMSGLLLAGLLLGVPSGAAEEAKANEPTLSELFLEIEVLRTLHHFNLAPEQLRAIRALAGETADKFRPRLGKGSKEFRQVLVELRAALVDATSAERIDALEEKLDALLNEEAPELSSDYEITHDARVRTPEVLRLLRPPQVAGYLALFADDVADPLESLLASFDRVRRAGDDEWEDLRDDLAYEIAWLLAGANPQKSDHVNNQVSDLLDRVRTLSAADFKSQRPELEKKARSLAAIAGPTDVLRNYLEWSLAEMLSNPRLAPALDARLKGK
jgi:hypothetical protein